MDMFKLKEVTGQRPVSASTNGLTAFGGGLLAGALVGYGIGSVFHPELTTGPPDLSGATPQNTTPVSQSYYLTTFCVIRLFLLSNLLRHLRLTNHLLRMKNIESPNKQKCSF